MCLYSMLVLHCNVGECWYCWYSSIRIGWSAKESQQGPHVTLWNATSQENIRRRDTACSIVEYYMLRKTLQECETALNSMFDQGHGRGQ